MIDSNSRHSLSRRDFVRTAFSVGALAAVPLAIGAEKAFGEEEIAPGAGVTVPSATYENGEIIDVDLLIIGSGFAGLWAALTAADKGIGSIALVDKGAIGKSGVSNMVFGGSIYMMPDDDASGWLQELVETPGYLSRQDIWQDLLAKTYPRLQRYSEWGLKWVGPRMHTDGNRYVAVSQAPLYNGIPFGRGVIQALLDQVQQHKGIQYYSKTMIVKLLVNEGRIAGALGINRVHEKAVGFRSRAVVLATGKCSFRGPHVTTEVETGDGYALAYDAGAVLNNMEFWAFDIDPAGYGVEGGTLLPQYGARLINGNNQDFMWDYDPVNGPAADARISSRAMAVEVRAGRGPIFMDRTTYQYLLNGQYSWDKKLTKGSWQRLNEKRILENGHDPTQELEQYYANSFGIIGAIRADIDCSTDVEGFFVSSTALSADPGKTKGCESARASWSGETAGASAAAYISKNSATTVVPNEDIIDELGAILLPLGRNGSVTPNDITWSMQEALFGYHTSLLKTESGLKEALKKIRDIREIAEVEMQAVDAHELVKYYETRNMLLCAELHLMASIERKESRVCHYREDYPKLDNKSWLKWINFMKDADGAPVMSFEDVPIENYPLKPKEG
jgi:succinate dehydrogenase/fumarate reductase flavoprotein subunit